MMSDRVWLRIRGTIGVLATLLASTTVVSAAEVTLKMRGGDFSVTGDLQAFENSKYTIQSKSFGTMTLDAARFECEGACPKLGAGPAPSQTAALVRGQPLNNSKIAITGSNTIGNQLMPALIQTYSQSLGLKSTKIAAENPLDLTFKLTDAKGKDAGSIELHRHGSTTAFTSFEQRISDIGMASRPIKPDEAAKLINAGLGDLRLPSNEHVLGLDGLVVLVAPGNPAVSMSIENVAKIFSGSITDWSELGLPPGKINIYAPTADSGTGETFDALVLKPRALKISANAKRFENHAEQSDLVAADPSAIGFAGIAYQRNAKSLNVEMSCGLISRPSNFVMKTEEYPLTRRLFLYTPSGARDPLARGLLDYALSPAAQPVIRQSDFVDQAPETLDFQSQTTRIAYALNAAGSDFDLNLMKTLISDFKPASRLSTTFRFDTANFALDSKASADIGRLRSLLEQAEYRGKTVILAGFADGVGRFDTNLTLSQKRAATVLAALRQGGDRGIQANLVTRAYSQLAPVACNDSPEQRSFNRRVEVWIK
jgi:phosphate transport system substrate-binding protein